MRVALSVLAALGLAIILSTTWITTAVLTRMQSAVYLPQAIRYLGAALVLLCLALIRARRPPQISLRLFHAAITVAALAYVLSPLLYYYSLRTLSSGVAALVYVSLPLWFVYFAYDEGSERLYLHLIVIAGLILFYLGVREDNELRGITWIPFLMCVCGMVASMAGIWVSRRLFWLHSAMDLNFWSMLFAGVTHLFLAITFREWEPAGAWSMPYWGLLLFYSIVVTGLGSYFYRVRASADFSVVLTALIPTFALAIGFAAWNETPMNKLTLGGGAAVIGVLVFMASQVRPNRWLVFFLNNDRRQGDRLICVLQGELKRADGTTSTFQITNISMSGLGFRSQKTLTKGEAISISVPVALQNNFLSLDGKVSHLEASNSRDFPCTGGLEFRNISENRWQSLVEFLARLAKAEEE